MKINKIHRAINRPKMNHKAIISDENITIEKVMPTIVEIKEEETKEAKQTDLIIKEDKTNEEIAELVSNVKTKKNK